MGQFTGSNDYITGRKPMPTPAGIENVSVRFTLAMATADLDINDIGQIGILPAGCIPVSVMVDATDMDSSTAALTFQVGIGNLALQDAAGAVSADAKNTLMSTIAADGGAAWGTTVVTPGNGAGGASGGAFQQMLLSQPMMTVTQKDYDRAIIAKVAAAPTTAVAGTLGLTLTYRAAQ
jgi:hypothetical protein